MHKGSKRRRQKPVAKGELLIESFSEIKAHPLKTFWP